MYNVSSEYLNAISQPVRTFKMVAQFSYKNAAQAVFDDNSIMGEAMIESQAVSGSASCGIIDIGAVPSTTASLTIIDNEAGLKKYVGSSFTIRVSLLLENGEYEDVPMGTFYCDSAKTSRTGNRISVFGYDAMVTFKYTLTDAQRSSLTDKTPQAAVSILTESAKCDFNQDLSGFPNSDLQLDFSNTQVVTGWDGIMWIAQLMGCFARINRQNNLEFVQIKSTWESDAIVSVRNITGAERFRTTFSDDRIHIAGVSMPDANNNLVTRSAEISADDSNVTITLEKNPLIKSTYALEDILDNILAPLQTAYFYAFQSEIINDPALDVGDTVRLQGGEINGIPNNELVGFITHNTWRYRGRQEIVNTGQTTDTAAEPGEATQFYAQPKSQSEKLLDSLSGSTSQIQERVTVIEKGSGPKDRIVSPKYGRALVVQEPYSATHAVSALYICDSSGIVRTTINEMSTGTYAEPRFYYETHLRNPSNSGYDVYSKFGSDNSSGYKGIEAKWFDGGHYSITISSKKGTDGCSIEFRRPRNGTSTQDKFTLCIDEEGGTPCLKLITDTQSGYHSYKATLEQLS